MKMKSKKSAFALAIVIWIVAALLLGIAFIMNLANDNLKTTKVLDSKLKTRLEAISVIEVLKYAMLTSNYDSQSIFLQEKLPYDIPKHLFLDGRNYKIEKGIEFTLQDTSALLSVFHPNFELLARFATDNREQYFAIKDSVWDWIDEDNIVRLNGAESSFYKFKRSAQYGPRNYSAIQSINELRLVNGVYDLSDEKWKKLKKFLSLDGSSNMNVVLMKRFLLQKLLKLSDSQSTILESYKKTDMNKFYRKVEASRNYDNEVMSFALSFVIDVNLTVNDNRAATNIESMIRFKKLQDNRILVKSYKIY